MKTHPNDDLVRGLARVHDEALAGYARRPAAQNLLAAVTAAPVRRRSFRPARRVAVPVVAGIAAAAVAAGMLTLGGGSSRTGAPPTVTMSEVAQVTSLVSAAALKQPDLHPRDDQFVHIKSVELNVEVDTIDKKGRQSVSHIPRINREMWLSVDQHHAGLLRETPCESDPPCDTVLDAAKTKRTGLIPGSTAAMRSLPTSPAKLLKAIDVYESGNGPARPELRWEAIRNMIQEQYVSPKVRAALFKVIGGLPGATVDRSAHDVIGRPGVAIVVTDALGTRHEMIFDRRTYQFFGSADIAGPPVPAGKLITPFPGATPYRRPSGGPTPAAGTVLYSFALLSVSVADHPPTH